MPQENSIGALWVKQGKTTKFYSGYIEVDGKKIEVIAFKNDTSKNPKAPSVKIFKSIPRDAQTSTQEVSVVDTPF